MSQLKRVTADGATASQALYFLISLYQTGNQQNINMANLYLSWLQYGRTIPAGIIPLTTPNIMYKTEDESLVPNEYILYQNYPNPFNPTTQFSFGIPEAGHVTLEIFDILGRKIETVVDEQLNAGNYTYTWNATKIASGIYFYRLKTDEFCHRSVKTGQCGSH